ncbi:MAG: hypothetical protein GXO93_06350, partial [FCB group bacterium]|nr:hypothetical protein [FCB group bacterium]
MVLDIILLKGIDNIISSLVGQTFAKWLDDKAKKKTFEKALQEAYDKLFEEGYDYETKGALDTNFLIDEEVIKELWEKFLNPANDEDIDYEFLNQRLKSYYDLDKLTPKQEESIEFFVDQLIDGIKSKPELDSLITSKIIRQHDTVLSLSKKRSLIREYLKNEGKIIQEELDKTLEGNKYVEPLLEKREDGKKDRDDKHEQREMFSPIGINDLYVNRNDRKFVIVA